MIKIEKISKTFSDVVAISEVNFELEKGVNLLIGPNGAGKTTTLKCIGCIIQPDTGSITVFDKNPCLVKERIAFLSEDRKILRKMRVKDYMELLPLLYSKWDNRTFKKLLNHFSIPLNKPLDKLSAGMRTLFLLTCAISSSADVLLLDEPTQHLDPVKVAEIQNIIREIALDKIVVISTHHLEEAENFADRFVLINEGRVIYHDDVDSAKESHRVIQQNELTESDEVIGKIESGWLVKTDADKGRYPSLREIALVYLTKGRLRNIEIY
ncbi:MAG: ABC transporter ATP-binding protein [Thermotogaceae bacterium]|nr:ABC transporter ATP-binding protein [Thermotogaceae bacterium]